VAGIVLRRNGELLVQALLRPYAQIIFSSDLVCGALILAAIATFPTLALATLAAVGMAQLAVLAFGLGLEAVRDGATACMAVLTTLGINYALGGLRVDLVVIGALLAVLLRAAFQALLGRAALAALSLPMILATWCVALAAPALQVTPQSLTVATPWAAIPERFFNGSGLDVMAAPLFVHGAVAGVLVLLAIATWSRIALLLAAVGAITAAVVRWKFRVDVPWSVADLTASFNAVLTAIALGGVFFVPQPSSILLAAVGAAVSCVLSYVLIPVARVLNLSVLSLPFVVTTIVIVLACRMRERDRSPTMALPAERPEEALSRHLMRVRRFGDFAWLPFRLPFRGSWLVTQGHDGPHTHQGPWRHAFDFESAAADGATFTGTGQNPADHFCYGLPVLAAGVGTVDQVIDDIADNAVGGVNTSENWGNVVVIAHGSNLYSVSAHLQPRSIRVKPGDQVRAGSEIGRCGNSGRSLVPHLHFHVQRGPILGSETIPADFGDVVARAGDHASVAHRVIPVEGDRVRPITPDESLATALAFPPGSRWELTDAATGRRETAIVEIDLAGRRLLRSDAGRLYIEPYHSGLVVVAFSGRRDSLLGPLLPGLARVPFDQEATLSWSDRVPRRQLLAWPWTVLADIVAVVAPRLADFEVHYTSRRSEASLAVHGSGPGFTTQAVISLASTPHTVELSGKGRSIVVELRRQDDAPEGPGR
jgi:urea transporter